MDGEERVRRKGVPEEQPPGGRYKYEQAGAQPERPGLSCLINWEHFQWRLLAGGVGAVGPEDQTVATPISAADAGVRRGSGLAVRSGHIPVLRAFHSSGGRRRHAGSDRGAGPIRGLPLLGPPLGRLPFGGGRRLRRGRRRGLAVALHFAVTHCPGTGTSDTGTSDTGTSDTGPATIASAIRTFGAGCFDFATLYATRRGVVGAADLGRPTYRLASRSVFRRTRTRGPWPSGGVVIYFPLSVTKKVSMTLLMTECCCWKHEGEQPTISNHILLVAPLTHVDCWYAI